MFWAIKSIHFPLFIGIVLTDIGSAYYHSRPDNNTLVFDRIPMAIVFMSFLSAIIAECINTSTGNKLLFPLIILGIASVLWWKATEQICQGDMRFYTLVQIYSIVFTPLIFFLFPLKDFSRIKKCFISIILLYLIAKIFEHYDSNIYLKVGNQWTYP